MNKNAFTLAEVLITLAIVGIVATMTIPNLILQNQQKGWDTSASNFERKLGEALRIMNTQQTLAGYTTTEDFVNELKKYIKITKVCSNTELNNCFASQIVVEGSTKDISEFKSAKNINWGSSYNTDTVGLQFADGTSAIIAYNPECRQNPYDSNVISLTLKTYSTKTVDENGYEVQIEDNAKSGKYVKLGTDAISMIYDVSGSKSPNEYTETKDIRGINAFFTCTARTSTGTCVVDVGTSYSPLDCTYGKTEYPDYCNAAKGGYSVHYYAGAIKKCDELGLEIPSDTDLIAIKNAKLPNMPQSGMYWTSTLPPYSNDSVSGVNFGVSYNSYTSINKQGHNSLICTGNK